jgi:hypothetical protein
MPGRLADLAVSEHLQALRSAELCGAFPREITLLVRLSITLAGDHRYRFAGATALSAIG